MGGSIERRRISNGPVSGKYARPKRSDFAFHQNGAFASSAVILAMERRHPAGKRDANSLARGEVNGTPFSLVQPKSGMSTICSRFASSDLFWRW
jgi:hypothetical protein